MIKPPLYKAEKQFKSEFYPLEGEHFFFLTSPKNAEFIAQTLEKLRQENDY